MSLRVLPDLFDLLATGERTGVRSDTDVVQSVFKKRLSMLLRAKISELLEPPLQVNTSTIYALDLRRNICRFVSWNG